MITVYVKIPHENAVVREISGTDDLQQLVGGDYEVVEDDHLEGISLIVNEDARGVEANNFPITSDGFLDWVYGPCVFVKADGHSLTADDLSRIDQFLSAKG
ncbi:MULTISPECIES: DUF3846 domain-containing protein [Brevibacillus]|uniref:DUF3846 domain-containing protein n=1 Tax=Brevibacillus TaxID=55080 RepID=UPI000D0F8C4F|nr:MULTISPECIES: DUF3846 domain-containing protein [Brevibacillus]MED1944284.1 DUF3846 domain-containing protein [Brevibacillus formosus]MED1999344.1 DUF3846 domain-containing protein [Brevibacillus formosus]MED2082519.1 DUF3846 domain-containing protein [Brevibacillus formosus]PSK06695.1 hypothetical protein C7R94_28600 [Brevibacillus sp. NRRL NRS-603]